MRPFERLPPRGIREAARSRAPGAAASVGPVRILPQPALQRAGTGPLAEAVAEQRRGASAVARRPSEWDSRSVIHVH
ncbi:hypothetical protein GCM10010521_48280 [Streptomyces rameus]|uniref:Uncharacterized protein n=1 Tax=Streptomyces rameus TaxID=68261 RepID=A0ABP6NRF2_9ACTN